MAARRLAAFGVTISLLAIAAPGANASHAWNNYHWARPSVATPLTLEVGDNTTTTEWRSILVESNTDWNVSSVFDNFIASGRGTKKCRAVANTVQVCNDRYGRNGWLGLAQIWLSGGHIIQGVAKMNDTYFAMARYNNYSEKRHVLCQEVGHTFGLGHTTEDGTSQNTCMDYWKNETDDRISIAPNEHDYQQLELIYNHDDGSSSASGTGSGFAQPRGNGRDIFVEHLPNGQILVTFIFWADQGHAPPHGR